MLIIIRIFTRNLYYPLCLIFLIPVEMSVDYIMGLGVCWWPGLGVGWVWWLEG